MLVGSLLGTFHAWMVYRTYYPPLASDFSDVPNLVLSKEQRKHSVLALNRSDLEASPLTASSTPLGGQHIMASMKQNAAIARDVKRV